MIVTPPGPIDALERLRAVGMSDDGINIAKASCRAKLYAARSQSSQQDFMNHQHH